MMNMTIFYDIDDLSIIMIYDVLPDFNVHVLILFDSCYPQCIDILDVLDHNMMKKT